MEYFVDLQDPLQMLSIYSKALNKFLLNIQSKPWKVASHMPNNGELENKQGTYKPLY